MGVSGYFLSHIIIEKYHFEVDRLSFFVVDIKIWEFILRTWHSDDVIDATVSTN